LLPGLAKRMTDMAPTNSNCRNLSLPALLILPMRCLPPVECSFGVRPNHAAKWRPDAKFPGSTVKAMVIAPSGPTPGIAASSWLTELALCSAANSPSRSAGQVWKVFMQTGFIPPLEGCWQTVVTMAEHCSRRHAAPLLEEFGFERFAAVAREVRQPHNAATEAQQGNECGANCPQRGKPGEQRQHRRQCDEERRCQPGLAVVAIADERLDFQFSSLADGFTPAASASTAVNPAGVWISSIDGASRANATAAAVVRSVLEGPEAAK
jgi:hypothetical protein